ncbi:MAG: fasciclin domain-containing protein [Acidimicrobiia bacterium]|nr:fasciclin domain-containing protein [Acidimicrobiia bacterium]
MRTRNVLIATIALMLSLIALPASAESETGGITVQSFDAATGLWNGIDDQSNPVNFYFGNPGDMPLLGDWDGDGVETPGLYRQSDGFFYGRNSNVTGLAEVSFYVGDPGDVPLVGDFDGDGLDTVSVYRPGEGRAFIMNTMGPDGGALGTPDKSYFFGDPGDKPFVGDFDGDGIDTIGLHRETTGKVYFTNSHETGPADYDFFFGDPGDVMLAGDWDFDGQDTVAVYRPSNGVLYMSSGNQTAGAAMSLYVGDVMPTGDGFAVNMPADIVDTAVGAGTFNTLVAAVQAAGLEDTLRSAGPFTVLAPTDDAFAALGTDTINALLADPDTLADILLYHVISGAVTSDVVVTLDSATMANGDGISITIEDGNVVINDSATVTVVDIMASNGVIHVLDAVLLPPADDDDDEPMLDDIVDTAVGAGTFNTLVAAVQAAGLEDTLRSAGPFTVLAPTDDAFARLGQKEIDRLLANPHELAEILKYHVIQGKATSDVVLSQGSFETVQGHPVFVVQRKDGVLINDANLIATDVMAANGVIHVIDKVLYPKPVRLIHDIVDEAIEIELDTLVAAVQAANLEHVLRSEGPFTVFAPTDEAFAELGTETLKRLLANPDELADILLYHVVSGETTSKELGYLDSVGMVNGDRVHVDFEHGYQLVNDARIIKADTLVANGIIHIIDKVLIPR